MKLLVALRTLSIAVALLCVIGSFVTTGVSQVWLRKIARDVGLGALGLALGETATDVATRKSPATRLVLPLLAVVLAAVTSFTGIGSRPLLVVFAALDAVIGLIALVSILRVCGQTPSLYAEDAFERELGRFATGPIVRLVAVECVTLAAAVRFCCGGFRQPLPSGFSYVRRWTMMPLLLVAPVLLAPEALAFDLLLSHSPTLWRVINDGLHVYAVLWTIGIYAMARRRPHRCDDAYIRLRIAALKRLDLPRDAVGAAVALSCVTSARALRAPGTLVMALSGSPAVQIALRKPVEVRTPLGRTRTIERVIVAVDEPHVFAAALAA